MFSGMFKAALDVWNLQSDTNDHDQPRPRRSRMEPEFDIPCSYYDSPRQIPGSLIIEEIDPSEMETDIEGLASQLEDTDLDEDTIEYETQEEIGYFTTNEAADDPIVSTNEGLRRNKGSSSGAAKRDAPLPPDIHVVAHSTGCQANFDALGILWGVQWEVARLTTVYPNFSWDTITAEDITGLCGPNSEVAPLIGEKFFADVPEFAEYRKRERFLRQPALTLPWVEYDVEEELIRNGNNASLLDFGGKVSQRIHLGISAATPSATGVFDNLDFKFTLEQPAKSKSSRFSRFLGSRRLVECHFSKQDARKHKDTIINFFATKKLLINGRLFQAFYGHEAKVELMEINEDFGREPDSLVGDDKRMSLEDFISWHNNISRNSKQSINKWVSRFALGFSTSQPGLVFEPENMHFIDDIYADGVTQERAASHQIMTDGCGFLNFSALKVIQKNMAWENFPICVQARIAGAKGLFLLHPDPPNLDEPPRIWMRSSQVKVKLNPDKTEWSPFHYIMDVLSGPFLQDPSSITYEMILCLSANDVPDESLSALLRESIQKDARNIEPSSKPNASKILWDSIYNSCRVLQTRLRQVISPELQRAQGFLQYGDDDELDPDGLTSPKWDVGPDPASGTPASAQEQVLGWLQAGFAPTDSFVVEKLVYLQKKILEAALKKYRIGIPKSLRAFIVPDPLGVLKKNEIFFASSQPLSGDNSGLNKHSVTGPVIVSRNPCIQVSDARKVMAVNSHELWSRGFYDVIVFSTKGKRSLASLLSGGDYDGDTVVMIWDETITQHFVNSHEKYADPSSNFEKENFDTTKPMLRDLVARSELEHAELVPRLLVSMLQGISPNQLGIYNTFYRNSAYVNGLDHPATARLGHMFTQCLDAVKSGVVVKDIVFSRDRRTWDKRAPSCFPQENEDSEFQAQKNPLPPRNPGLPRFILEVLKDEGEREKQLYTDRLAKLRDSIVNDQDADMELVQPFEDARKRARVHKKQEELDQIITHVERYRKQFVEARCNQGEFSPETRYGRRIKKDISIGERQESGRAVSNAYNTTLPCDLTLFDDDAVRRVAASYAYILDTRVRRFNFCFSVAWAELCAIKARAGGGSFVTLAPTYIETMAIQRRIVKVFREMDCD